MGLSIGSIEQLTIQRETRGAETAGNTLFKQRREREMVRGLCGVRDSSGKTASSRRRDSDYARAGTYG